MTPERVTSWLEGMREVLVALPKGTQAAVLVAGDSLAVTDDEEASRTQGHSDFRELAVKAEFITIVYRHLGNVDIHFDFTAADSGAGAGTGVSRDSFYTDFIKKQRLAHLANFLEAFGPVAQHRHTIVTGTTLKDILDAQVFSECNKCVHNITFCDMYDLLVTLRYSDRGREAAVFETLCAAATATAYSDEWKSDKTRISVAAARAFSIDFLPLPKESAALTTAQKNRESAATLRHMAKKFEAGRAAISVTIYEETLAKKGWLNSDRISQLEERLTNHDRYLRVLSVGMVLILGTLWFGHRGP
ncbi:hypothetical protein C8R44DRAFT_789937 [Mycena epipterygia]|nr:hypothetical protein C8R44DRAFT_789937 [Mycena epipterygia]